MQRPTKVIANNDSVAVSETVLVKQSDEALLSTRPKDWSAYLSSGPVASYEFMENVEDLPTQERELCP